MPRHSRTVSSATVAPNRAANCAARKTLSASSANVFSDTCRMILFSRSARPPQKVQYLVRERVEHHGVDGEVPPNARLPGRHERIDPHVEVGVLDPRARLPAGHGGRRCPCGACRLRRTTRPCRRARPSSFKSPAQHVWRHAKDFDIDVLSRPPPSAYRARIRPQNKRARQISRLRARSRAPFLYRSWSSPIRLYHAGRGRRKPGALPPAPPPKGLNPFGIPMLGGVF